MRSSTAVILILAGSVAGSATGYWCPGVLQGHGGGTTDNYCCVPGSQATISKCPGWPLCNRAAIVVGGTATSDCSASVPVTTSNYDELISSASSKYLKSGGDDTPATATSTSDDANSTDDDSESDTGTANGAAITAVPLLAPICAGAMAYAAMG
ncbi:hypothetical protein FALBO_13243 [Fusarium albosuccineum]|uniref:Extracellular membrane protein CFEM domain-containing protein n=1 Tax=Fusarium albosuccineum TaxID=1237068 RepID=A0A8H4L2G7_9HYPO|nr:hypothetical protein FALBO_13243 [Fusarium albosuccineum]